MDPISQTRISCLQNLPSSRRSFLRQSLWSTKWILSNLNILEFFHKLWFLQIFKNLLKNRLETVRKSHRRFLTKKRWKGTSRSWNSIKTRTTTGHSMMLSLRTTVTSSMAASTNLIKESTASRGCLSRFILIWKMMQRFWMSMKCSINKTRMVILISMKPQTLKAQSSTTSMHSATRRRVSPSDRSKRRSRTHSRVRRKISRRFQILNLPFTNRPHPRSSKSKDIIWWSPRLTS